MAIVIRGEEMAFRHVANYPHIDPVTRSHIFGNDISFGCCKGFLGTL
jgi:hypothetical protein